MSQHHKLRNRNLHRQNKAPTLPRSLDPRFSPTAIFSDPSTPTQVPAAVNPPASNPPASQPAPPVNTPASTPAAPVNNPQPSKPPASTPPAPPASQTPANQPAPVSTPPSSSAPAPASTPASTPAAPPPASSSNPAPAAANPTTPSAANPSTPAVQTQTFIQTVRGSSIGPGVGSLASASSSPSSTAAPSGGSSSGAIAGGVIAGLVAVAGIAFAIYYFVHKSRKREEAASEAVWNPDDARRQSVMLGDEPSFPPPMARSLTMNRGDNSSPRPPTMIERKLNNQASMLARQNTYGGQYNNMDNGYGNDYGAMGHSSFQSFAPGEYITSPTMASPPITATSANPFMSPYAQDVLPSPTFDQVSYPQAAITRQPSGQYVTRQPSMNGPSLFSPVTPATLDLPEDDPHYVDLSRSSVSPYQAAQYAEISRKLGAPPPAPLVLGAVPEEQQQLRPPPSALTTASYAPDAGLNSHLSMPPAPENANPESPFADPGMYDSTHPVPSRKEYTPHVNSMASANGNIHARTKSNPGDPVTDADMEDDAQELEFPEPPAMADLTHQRVDSTPPQLPEIVVQQRAFSPVSYDFPIPHSVSATPSSFSTEFGGDVHGSSNMSQSRSPLAMHSPMQGEAAESTKQQQQQRPNPGVRSQERRPMSTATTYTVYDDEDAYGGI